MVFPTDSEGLDQWIDENPYGIVDVELMHDELTGQILDKITFATLEDLENWRNLSKEG
jgi:hypothetical protein